MTKQITATPVTKTTGLAIKAAITSYNEAETAKQRLHGEMLSTSASQVETLKSALKGVRAKPAYEDVLEFYVSAMPRPELADGATTEAKNAHAKTMKAYNDKRGMVCKAMTLIMHGHKAEAPSVKTFISDGRDFAKAQGLWTVRDSTSRQGDGNPSAVAAAGRSSGSPRTIVQTVEAVLTVDKAIEFLMAGKSGDSTDFRKVLILIAAKQGNKVLGEVREALVTAGLIGSGKKVTTTKRLRDIAKAA